MRLRRGDLGVPSGIVRVHRLAFWLAKGPFPVACQIDHMCRTAGCVEPEHLQLLGPVEHAGLSNMDRWQRRREKAENLHIKGTLPETEDIL